MAVPIISPPITLTWYEDHYKSLYQLIHRQVECVALTQDILQDLYLKLSKIPDVSAVNNPKNYLMQIACRLVIDNKRLKVSQVETGQDETLAGVVCPIARPEHTAINTNLIANVKAALAKLPEDKRDLIWLSAIEGWSYPKIASHKGRSLSWVEKSIAQAMVLLSEFKRQSHEAEE